MTEVVDAPQLPHGMMGLQPQAFPWMAVILFGLGLALLGLIGWFLWKYLRRQTVKAPAFTSPQPTDPWARLEQDWQGLVIAEPWTRETCENFFFRLSFLLREALELRTGLPISAQTLVETRHSLEKSRALSANFQEDLIKFLSLADQLKFAGQWLSAAESIEWREKVKTWMDQLRREALS
jgi:hypothetical protein